jgi:hypothetical protein
MGNARSEVTELPLNGPGGAALGHAVLLGGGLSNPDSDRLRQYASDIETLTEVGNILSELQDPDEAAAMICTVATGATRAIAVLLWERAGEGELAAPTR